MNKDTNLDREMISNTDLWPGETLCLKKRPLNGEPTGVMGYSKFGIITSPNLPITIYLREDFIQEEKYASIDALLDAGWIVD